MMDHYSDQARERIKKLEALKQEGFEPYPNDFKPTHLAGEIQKNYASHDREALEKHPVKVAVSGRMKGFRSFGKAAFIQLRDRSGDIQAYVAKDALGEKEYAFFKDFVDVGDIVGIEGQLFRTKTNELTVKAASFRLLSKCLHPLPEKWHGLTDVEARYRQRYLDLIVNPGVGKVFRARSRLIQEMRQFFLDYDYLEVETPMMQPIAGGALARPFVTRHHTLDMDLYLRIAPELYLKRLVVGGMERVFEINRNFRNEGISTQHNPEFTMIEFYQAYATYEDLMLLTEELLNRLAKEVLGHEEIVYQDAKISLKRPFQRFTFDEAILKFTDLKKGDLKDVTRLQNFLQSKKIDLPIQKESGHLKQTVFDHCVEEKLVQPTFILQYPLSVSPLSRKNDQDPARVDRFELFIYGREIANAFSELNDPFDQRERFLAQEAERKGGDQESHEMDEDYVRALEYGMPPTAGEGIGVDRLVMLFTNAASIRDVILFPQLRKS